MKTQPRMGRQIPSPYERQYLIASPEPGNAPEHEALSRKASKPPRCPSSPFWNPSVSTGLKSARSASRLLTNSPGYSPGRPGFGTLLCYQ
jgi:hypothetical protein